MARRTVSGRYTYCEASLARGKHHRPAARTPSSSEIGWACAVPAAATASTASASPRPRPLIASLRAQGLGAG